jgi:acetolactate synthase I/II/III large subunit
MTGAGTADGPPEPTVGERLVEILQAGGDRPIFGIPGGQTFPLYAATRARKVTHLVMRDERNAVTAADGWARVAGSIGVCDATVGPGVTNLVSGLAEAMASSIPVLAVVADIRRDREHLRRRSIVSQGMEQGGLLASVSKWVARLQEPGSLDELVAHALRVATSGRPGPVVLEIPEDVFTARLPRPPSRTFDEADFAYPRHRSAPTVDALDAAVAVLEGADRPVILAGGGVVLSRSAPAVAAFARELQIPVVTSINGKGTIDERDRLAGGVTGVFGTVRATRVLQAADVVLVLGSKLDQSTTHRFRVPARAQRVVHVDLDGEEIGRTGPVAVAVLADVGETCRALLPRLRGRLRHDLEWYDAIPVTPTPGSAAEDDDAVAPTEVAEAIAAGQQERDVLLCDASLSSGWGAANAVLPGEGVRFLAPRGLAGLGWSCGAAIGARLAMPEDASLVVLAGDGGWAYGLGEVETVARARLPITSVILNNSALAWVVHGEVTAGITPTSTFSTVDFAAAARAMGAEGSVAHTIDELRDQLARARVARVPWVIDVRSSAVASPVLALSRINRTAR